MLPRFLTAPMKIRFRIAILFTVAASFIVSVAMLGAYFALSGILRNEVEENLFSQFLSLSTLLDDTQYLPGGEVRLSPRAVQRVRDMAFFGVVTVVRDSLGGKITVPEQLYDGEIFGPPGYFPATVNGQEFIFYNGRAGRLDISVGLREDLHFSDRLQLRSTALGIIVSVSSLLALFVSYLVTSRVLSPVSRLAEFVEIANPEDADKEDPIASHFPKDEIGALASVFDRFMERIRFSIIREKEFVSDAGHELRTPLTVIRTSVELLLESSSCSEKAVPKLRNILAAADKMDRLTSELLELRKETKTFFEAETVSFPETLYGVAEPLEPFLKERGVKLEIVDGQTFRSEIPLMEFEKILTNLIRNAAIHSGTDRIVLSAEAGTVSVKDFGIGIPDEEKVKIFDRFYRTDKSRGTEGFGLGLPIVKKIADREGWKIRVSDTESGKGATFSLSIPVSSEKKPSKKQQPA